MTLKVDQASYIAGYKDGKEGHHRRKATVVDGYSYSSGWIEGEARKKEEEK